MRFNDHILDYTIGAERFDTAAAQVRLLALIQVMVGLHYRRGFMTAVRAVSSHVRAMRHASEQAARYRCKLAMLRDNAWRGRVFAALGGQAMIKRWANQRRKRDIPPRREKTLHARERARREHIRRCAKACAHPRVLRDPCRLDEGGIFRLPPMRKHVPFVPIHPNIYMTEYRYDARPVYKVKGFSKPIMVWPDEFKVFAAMEAEEAQDTRERAIDYYKVLLMSVIINLQRRGEEGLIQPFLIMPRAAFIKARLIPP